MKPDYHPNPFQLEFAVCCAPFALFAAFLWLLAGGTS
jgi:hypothetical protein